MKYITNKGRQKWFQILILAKSKWWWIRKNLEKSAVTPYVYKTLEASLSMFSTKQFKCCSLKIYIIYSCILFVEHNSYGVFFVQS